MWIRVLFTLELYAVALLAGAQTSPAPWAPANNRNENTSANYAKQPHDSLSQDDRLSILAAALDSRTRRYSETDCSHLVHAIYQRAGFPYSYAPSFSLYAGIEPFRAVKYPQPGDLVVWRGHVGIVIKPSQHLFFSLLRSGSGIDDYQAPYWKSLGRPRFFRYVKHDRCLRCRSVETWSDPPLIGNR
jgi:cell wall-associated NlpC family hydrolase